MDMFDRLLELSGQGFFCAQIMMQVALDTEGKANPDLIRAMGGLNSGLGYTGNVCGAMTGGCCVLSYFAGKGEVDELEDPDLNAMIAEYVDWFKTKLNAAYSGHTCSAILEGDPKNKVLRCPQTVESSIEKVFEILQARGII